MAASVFSSSWVPDVKAKIHIKHDQDTLSIFFGNATDYFKILDQDDHSLLIGARNAMYNISLNGLIEDQKSRIEWTSSDAHRELCVLKGKQEFDCQNYIRVFARISDTEIMICGTNSYKPLCRYYNKVHADEASPSAAAGFEMANEVEAQGQCPYNPVHNSTYIFTDGQLYSATVADFSGADPLIYRETQRTEQYDLKQLNQPGFVSAVEREDYVFFFFREMAMEYMNCGKAIYSRVGRVCKKDKGGPYPFGDRWSSFLKARLNCSVPGDYPFYFDEIQATTQIIDGSYGPKMQADAIMYAVFTTPKNAIPGSAICAFRYEDILAAFEGRFKAQRDINSNWLPVAAPEPRPGVCVEDSRTLPGSTFNFVKMHSLMEQAVPAMYSRPLLTRVNLQHRFMAITVDPQIMSIDNVPFDVIFAGTDDGRVVKFTNTFNKNGSVTPVVISETQALPHGMQVRELTVSRKTQSLVVIGDGHIVTISLHHCSKLAKCKDCMNLQDPYCMWDIKNHECTSSLGVQEKSREHFIQRLTNPDIDLCKQYGESGNMIDPPPPSVIHSTRGTVASVGRGPIESSENEITVTSIDGIELTDHINQNQFQIDPIVKGQLDGQTSSQAGMSMMSWVITFSVVLTLILGMFIGHLLTRRFCKNSPFHGEHRNQLNWHGKPRHIHHQPRNSGKDINLLMNTNQFPTPCNNKKDNLEHEFGKDRSHECKNSTENLEKEANCKTGTLQKVKKTYI